MNRSRASRLTTLFLLLVSGAPAARGEVQSTESIRAAAAHFLESDLGHDGRGAEVEIGYIDRRLRMPRCARALEAFVPPGGRRRGQITVGVRCPGDQPWKLFVDARVRLYDRIVVTRRPLVRGEVVGADDLRLARRDVSRLQPGYYTDPGAVAGKHLVRAVSPGTVLTDRLLKVPPSVRRGQRVILLARSAGLEVRMEGRALANAAIGDVVKVRNQRSRQVVEGVVIEAGVVDVPL